MNPNPNAMITPTLARSMILFILFGCLSLLKLQAQEAVPQDDKGLLRFGLLYYPKNNQALDINTGFFGLFVGYKSDLDKTTRVILQAQYSGRNYTEIDESSTNTNYTSPPSVQVRTRSFTLLSGFDYHYLNWKKLSVYFGIETGISLHSKSKSPGDETENIAFHIGFKPWGVQYDVGDKFGIFMDFGFNTEAAFHKANGSVLTYGMRYKL